jgi:hypothetical protein
MSATATMMRLWCNIGLVFTLHAQDPLEHAREVNLRFVSALPNFVADEHSERYKSSVRGSRQWQLVDTIDSEISIKGGSGFSREHTTVNGKPWTRPNLPDGAGWSVAFGQEIRPLFDTKCRTVVRFEQKSELRGLRVLVYHFESPENGCFVRHSVHNGMFSSTKTFNPPLTGRFAVEEAGGSFVQFGATATGFPKGFGSDTFEQSISWDYVKIGDESRLLPTRMEMVLGLSAKVLWRVVVDYKNHRHFEASTNLRFEPEK